MAKYTTKYGESSDDDSDDNKHHQVEAINMPNEANGSKMSNGTTKLVGSRFHVDRVHSYDIEASDIVETSFTATIKSLDQGGLDLEDEDDTLPLEEWQLMSFKHFTREALPRIENYRHESRVRGWTARPSLDEIHGPQATVMSFCQLRNIENIQDVEGWAQTDSSSEDESNKTKPKQQTKFGWVEGVLIRCLLNIWGVMLFLRLSWVGGQAGVWLGSGVVLLSALVTVFTTISMSAICTNGEVKTGGTYYMISRSLGPEFGGAIGIVFSLANAIAVAMYAIGFAEALRDMFLTFDLQIVDGGLNDVRIISSVTITILLVIVFIGSEWESKTQMGLLVILLLAMLDFLVGVFLPPRDDQKAQGFVGPSTRLLQENMHTDYRDGQSFFSVFAIFFPAATGITAGANISGDLRNPSQAIPKGTMLAVVITTLSYVVFLVLIVSCVSRDANGLTPLVTNVTQLDDLLTIIGNCSHLPSGRCPYGTSNNFQVMQMMSAFAPIIYAGIFAATLSSALASLVSGPKIFQALCQDGLFPYIAYFGKEFGVNKEPKRGYGLAFGVALLCCLIGELNAIAPIISNFFLAAYLLMNFSCFHASLTKSPGFRPSYRWYNQWISLLGALLCMSVMFITSWATALLTFIIIVALYMYIGARKPDVNWGSSTQAQVYVSAVNNVYRLSTIPEHVKTYRPTILLLSGTPSSRATLVSLGSDLTRGVGLLICGHVLLATPPSMLMLETLKEETNHWLVSHRLKGTFYSVVHENSFHDGVRTLLQAVGLGKLVPNIVMLGFKRNWTECKPAELVGYFQTIHFILDRHLALVVVALPEKQAQPDDPLGRRIFAPKLKRSVSRGNLIDVWWLYDNGGLTILLPYLLSMRESWKGARLRIFTIANKASQLEFEHRNVAALLAKLRINYEDLILITDIMRPPRRGTRREFAHLIKPYILANDESKPEADANANQTSFYVTQADLDNFKEKTERHLRLRELLLHYSRDSRLVVMSLPVPRKSKCPAVLYMSWLTMLTLHMPPMMLVRGNHTDVLTFYS